MKPHSGMPRAIPVVLTVALALLVASPAATETVNILWISFPSVGGTTIDLQVGDTIEWDIDLGHDLSEMPSQALFDACDLTGSTLISIGPAVTPTTFNTPGVHYFACSVGLGLHCDSLNMKVTVVVSEGEPELMPMPVPLAWPPGVAAALALAGLAALLGGGGGGSGGRLRTPPLLPPRPPERISRSGDIGRRSYVPAPAGK